MYTNSRIRSGVRISVTKATWAAATATEEIQGAKSPPAQMSIYELAAALYYASFRRRID